VTARTSFTKVAAMDAQWAVDHDRAAKDIQS
jgi:hypothetical protein